MEYLDLLFILIIALVIGAIFYYGFGKRGPYGAFWIFLLILFLAGLAGRYWITPAGPVIWGFAWLPLIFWIFIIGLLLAAATPVKNERVDAARDQERIISSGDVDRVDRERITAEDRRGSAGVAAAFGIFFWLLLLLLIIAIIAGLFL